VKRIINIGTELIQDSGKLKEASTVMLAKLLTRPDVIKIGETDTLLKSYTELYEQGREDASNILVISGIVETLVAVFKFGHRDDLLKRVPLVFEKVIKPQIKNKFNAKSTVLKKAKANLA
jgi:hypothetical protein